MAQTSPPPTGPTAGPTGAAGAPTAGPTGTAEPPPATTGETGATGATGATGPSEPAPPQTSAEFWDEALAKEAKYQESVAEAAAKGEPPPPGPPAPPPPDANKTWVRREIEGAARGVGEKERMKLNP
jgi:hypothetical protein